MRTLVAIMLLGTGLAGAAWAQPMPPELDLEVSRLAKAAEDAGLPGDLLVTKAKEGGAKGVPAARVIAVLTTMRQQMDEAALAMDKASLHRLEPRTRRELVGAITGARQAGVASEVLQRLTTLALHDKRNPSALQGAVYALTDLVAQGFDKGQAESVVTLALERGFAAGDFGGLVRVAHEHGGPSREPGQVLEAIQALLRAGRRPDSLGGRSTGPIDKLPARPGARGSHPHQGRP